MGYSQELMRTENPEVGVSGEPDDSQATTASDMPSQQPGAAADVLAGTQASQAFGLAPPPQQATLTAQVNGKPLKPIKTKLPAVNFLEVRGL